MDSNDALFTSDEPVRIELDLDPARPTGERRERWIRFSMPGRPICQRVLRSERDAESALAVFAEPVHLHAAAIESEGGEILIALLAQVLTDDTEPVFLPTGNGVRSIATTPARFYPLGDILIDPLERRHPFDMVRETRCLLADLLPVAFSSDLEREAVDELLRSVG